MWIYLIAIICGLCFAALLYLFNRKQHYSKTLTVILFIARTLAVGAVISLLFNPYIKRTSNIVEPSTIIIAQDNSTSLVLNKDSVFYKNDYHLVLDTLINKIEKKFTVDKYLFGNSTKEFDSLDFKDYHTDFHELLENIKKNYYKKNVGALVILSDGICNKSHLPEQNIESYPFPIYTVTLGDTTNYPDLYIKEVFYNKTSPTNTSIPIRLVANANNCRGKNMEIVVLADNEVHKEINIPINSNRFSQTIDFSLESGDEGIRQIDIQIKQIDNETANNNSKRFFIEVIDKQYKALICAKAPHPDLGSIRNILGDNFDFEMIFNGDEITEIEDYDIIILHQIPYLGMNNFQDLDSKLKENKKIPVFHIIGANTDFEKFNGLQENLTIKKGAVNSTLDIKAYYNQNFGLFSIDNEVVEAINTFPPLSLPHIEISSKAKLDILLQMNIRDVMTQAPLLSFSNDKDGRKNAYLFGTGIWKWKLNDYYKENDNDNFEEIITKSVKYLLTEKDKELLVRHEDTYLNNEAITFTADLRNPSQELTNEPELMIRIINKHSKDVFEYSFLKKEKSYHLSIDNLPEGIYNFSASTELGGVKYYDSGSFSVVSVGAEAQELVANSRRMQSLAALTGGENFSLNELDNLAESIDNDERITSIMREETNYKDLINMKSIFFIILSLVSIEWILRKMFGTY